MKARALLCLLACLTLASIARSQTAAHDQAITLDRAVLRFVAPETGGTSAPQFIFERVLAFEARVEALADRDHRDSAEPYRERHVYAAVERHIAETLLSALAIDPEPTEQELARQIEAARAIMIQRVGGPAALREAQRAEGIGSRELRQILRRQARASLYLDRMVAPMLRPSEAELAAVHRSEKTPFFGLPYEEIAPALRRWYIARKLSAALGAFYQNARARLRVTILVAPGP